MDRCFMSTMIPFSLINWRWYWVVRWDAFQQEVHPYQEMCWNYWEWSFVVKLDKDMDKLRALLLHLSHLKWKIPQDMWGVCWLPSSLSSKMCLSLTTSILTNHILEERCVFEEPLWSLGTTRSQRRRRRQLMSEAGSTPETLGWS